MESIITKLQKLYSPPRNLRAGNKSPVQFLKKCFCTGDLSSPCKVFIEKPEILTFLEICWKHDTSLQVIGIHDSSAFYSTFLTFFVLEIFGFS